MAGSKQTGAGGRTVTYCLLPLDLAGRLHDVLRSHFADHADIEVVIERRLRERRSSSERRHAEPREAAERRLIRNAAGRRIGPRRAPHLQVAPPGLPRKARAHADRIVFVERVEPGAEHLADLDSARLVTRFQAGDEDAFAKLYLRYFDRVYAYLRVIFRETPDETEDVTQQVFLRAFEALPRYEQRGQPFRAWLFTVARNRALTRLGQLGRDEPVEPRVLDERRDVAAAEEAVSALSWLSDRELVMFVDRLPLPQRQVLALRYLLDLPTKEIARMLGRTVADVRMLEHRALRFLEARLGAVAGRTAPRQRPLPTCGRVMWMPVARRRRFALNLNPGRVGLK
jgi:RNA polymerase sigma-70 factor (ECF subfamily)